MHSNEDFTMPRVFVAGPYRADTLIEVVDNIRKAEHVGMRVAEMGAVPVIFHSLCRVFQGTMSESYMDEASLQLLSVCHAVVVTCSEVRSRSSKGTMNDRGFAKELGRPVFFAEGQTGDIYEDNLVRGGLVALGPWIADWKREAIRISLNGKYGKDSP